MSNTVSNLLLAALAGLVIVAVSLSIVAPTKITVLTADEFSRQW